MMSKRILAALNRHTPTKCDRIQQLYDQFTFEQVMSVHYKEG
ncbi:MAG: hypothetical protein V7K56_36460 [Nostoc sp.]